MRPPPARCRHHQSNAHVRAWLHATAVGAAAAKKHNHLALGIEKVGLVSKLGIEKIRSVSNIDIEKIGSVSSIGIEKLDGIENMGSVSTIGIEKI